MRRITDACSIRATRRSRPLRGARASQLRLGSRPREAWTFVALVIALLGLGLAPRPLVGFAVDASNEILRLRQERVAEH